MTYYLPALDYDALIDSLASAFTEAAASTDHTLLECLAMALAQADILPEACRDAEPPAGFFDMDESVFEEGDEKPPDPCDDSRDQRYRRDRADAPGGSPEPRQRWDHLDSARQRYGENPKTARRLLFFGPRGAENLVSGAGRQPRPFSLGDIHLTACANIYVPDMFLQCQPCHQAANLPIGRSETAPAMA